MSTYWRKALRWCLLSLMMGLCHHAACAALPTDVQCGGLNAPLRNDARAWEHYSDGRIVLTPDKPACWLRIDLAPEPHRYLAFAGNWVDVEAYSARGQRVATGRRLAHSANTFSSSSHFILPFAEAGPLYARVSLISGWRMAAEVTVAPADLAVLSEQDRLIDNANLAVVIVLFTSAVFLSIFAGVLRVPSYALLASFLLLTGWVRLLQTGHVFAFVSNADWIWPAWAVMWPLINAALALTCTSIGRFALHAPWVHRGCIAVALLYLPVAAIWLIAPESGDSLNAALNVPLYALLLAGSWRGMRQRDAACAILLVGNIIGALVWLPGVLARVVDLPWLAYSDPRIGQALEAAADLVMPLLLCVALARRQRQLQLLAQQLQEEAVELARHDALTGLLNREGIVHRFDGLLAGGGQFAVVVVNIDRFRSINETLGGALADSLLFAIGQRLRELDAPAAGRLHADHFCLLWPMERGMDDLRARLRRYSAEPLRINSQYVDLPLTAGVAYPGAEGGSATTLLRNAEIALDVARSQHLPWLVYAEQMENGRRADLGLLSELDRAIVQGELRMFLQPKIRLRDGQMISAEALVRWDHPVRGIVPPGQFVPFAVRTGRIGSLTDWVLEQAMALTARLRRDGQPLQVSVNVSARDLARTALADQLVAMAGRHGALPQDIRLEITESEAMDDPSAALNAMHQLCDAGFSLSIDDFGTGYSSLVYLQQMPVDELKIDRAFVSNVMPGSQAAVLLQSTIELGHRLGLSVVGEGPETAQEWELLRALGCDYAQGWHAAKAMSVQHFLDWRYAALPFGTARPVALARPPSPAIL